jgi:hypothetical protein
VNIGSKQVSSMNIEKIKTAISMVRVGFLVENSGEIVSE